MKFLDKIKEKINDYRFEKAFEKGDLKVSDKGYFFFQYCENLIKDPNIQHIDAYDEVINKIANQLDMSFMDAVDNILSVKMIVDIKNQD